MIHTAYYGAHKSKRALFEFLVDMVSTNYQRGGKLPGCLAAFKDQTKEQVLSIVQAVARDGVSFSTAKTCPIDWSVHKIQRDAYYKVIVDMIE